MSTLLCMLRHAQTCHNLEKRIQGQNDSPLSPHGETQADAWGPLLAPWNFSRIVSSSLGRAMETARRCNAVLQLPLETDHRLQEQDWGQWVGCRIVDLRQKYRDLLCTQERSGWDFTPPGGESRRQLLDRAVACLQDTAARHPEQRLLLVSHNGLMRALAFHLLGIDYLPGAPDPLTRGRLLCIRAESGKLTLLDPARHLEAPL